MRAELQRLALDIGPQPVKGLGRVLEMGIYFLRPQVGLIRTLFVAKGFQNRAKPENCPVIMGVQGQRTLKIRNRRPVQIDLKIGGGPGMPTFRKPRRMVGQRGQVFDCRVEIADLERIAATFEQQIHRRRSGLAPEGLQFAVYPQRLGGIGRGQTFKQRRLVVGFRGRGRRGQRDHQQCRGYRYETFEFVDRTEHNGFECNRTGRKRQTRPNNFQGQIFMSELLDDIVAELNGRLGEAGFDGTAKLEIADEGAIVLSGETAQVSDGEADVTLSADADTVRAIIEKDLDPTAAFMSGRLTVDGDMGLAMKLASVLS